MITNEQVEAALKAWYDAGDAGNFASMFAALKAADLASVARIAELESMIAVHRLAVDVDALKARIAELEAALKPFADDVTSFEGFSDVWEIDPLSNLTVGDLRAARAALGEKG